MPSPRNTLSIIGLIGAWLMVGAPPPTAASPTTQSARPPTVEQSPAMALRAGSSRITLDAVPLSDALWALQEASGLNLHVNWAALEAVGVERDTPVSLNVGQLPVRKVLSLLLSGLGGSEPITFYIDQGVVEIAPQSLADQHLLTRVYPVEDLLMEIPDFVDVPRFDLQSSASRGGRRGGSGGGGSGGGGLFSGSGQEAQRPIPTRDARAQALIDLITGTVRPDIWRINGGVASIRHFRGVLIITAPISVHEAIGG